MNNLRVQYSNINFLLQIYVQKRLHEQLKIVNLITFGIVNKKIVFLCLLFDTDYFLANRSKFCGVMSDPTEGIKYCFTIITFSSNVIRNSFWDQIIKTLLIDLYSFIKLFKIKISTIPKVVQFFPLIWFRRILFWHELFLDSSWWRLKFHWWNLSQHVFIVFS